ncbi:MAG: hypothetical protein CMN76_12040 [Spirochaetaceae bacterium]|nr:hypothetical protein [Spirochaetaceae bacterium]|tara:strand:- start:22064 stop:22474 length:411 start_codon:yes stop_codon:yes gene_type:complete
MINVLGISGLVAVSVFPSAFVFQRPGISTVRRWNESFVVPSRGPALRDEASTRADRNPEVFRNLRAGSPFENIPEVLGFRRIDQAKKEMKRKRETRNGSPLRSNNPEVRLMRTGTGNANWMKLRPESNGPPEGMPG